MSEIFRRFEKPAIKKDIPDGAKIAALRQNAGITQAELAAKSGVSRQHISKIELGDGIAKIKTAKMLAKALGVELEKILN